MDTSGIDIEAIVREVIAQLKMRDPQLVTTGRPTAKNETPNAAAEQKAGEELEISEKLVTLATLENRLTGVRRLAVRRGTVVTPAVRDLLRERKIELLQVAQPKSNLCTLVLGAADIERSSPAGIAALVADVARDGIAVQQVAQTGLAGVVAELAEEAGRGGRPTVFLTSQIEAAVCLANRHRGVRGVGGSDLARLRRGIQDVAANFVALDPRKDPQGVRTLLREYCGGWPRSVPALFAGEQGKR